MSKRHLQYQIQKRERADTANADDWIQQHGLNPNYFQSVDPRLLQAQRVAHTLLTEHAALLNPMQQEVLQTFQKRMACKRSRSRLRPQAANLVLNVGSQINRKIFKQYRSLIKENNKGERPGNH